MEEGPARPAAVTLTRAWARRMLVPPRRQGSPAPAGDAVRLRRVREALLHPQREPAFGRRAFGMMGAAPPRRTGGRYPPIRRAASQPRQAERSSSWTVPVVFVVEVVLVVEVIVI